MGGGGGGSAGLNVCTVVLGRTKNILVHIKYHRLYVCVCVLGGGQGHSQDSQSDISVRIKGTL